MGIKAWRLQSFGIEHMIWLTAIIQSVFFFSLKRYRKPGVIRFDSGKSFRSNNEKLDLCSQAPSQYEVLWSRYNVALQVRTPKEPQEIAQEEQIVLDKTVSKKLHSEDADISSRALKIYDAFHILKAV